jgi:hypothetical protein
MRSSTPSAAGTPVAPPHDPARPVPSDALEAMWETFKEDPEVRLFLLLGDGGAAPVRRGGGRGHRAHRGRPAMIEDSQRWFRHRWADVQRLRDGPPSTRQGLPRLDDRGGLLLPPPSPGPTTATGSTPPATCR